MYLPSYPHSNNYKFTFIIYIAIPLICFYKLFDDLNNGFTVSDFSLTWIGQAKLLYVIYFFIIGLLRIKVRGVNFFNKKDLDPVFLYSYNFTSVTSTSTGEHLNTFPAGLLAYYKIRLSGRLLFFTILFHPGYYSLVYYSSRVTSPYYIIE